MESLKALEIEKAEMDRMIEKAAELKTLRNSRAFKKLFLEDYCKEEILRLNTLLPVVEDEQKQKVFAELEAIARFNHHMALIERMGLVAQDKIKEIDIAISEELSGKSSETIVEEV